MYSTDPQRLPTKPVVTSLSSANQEWARWLRENCYDAIIDSDGLDWELRLETDQRPDPADLHGSIWKTLIKLRTQVDIPELLRSKVLDPAVDARLIALMGESQIELAMRPIVIQARDQEETKARLIEELPRLRRQLSGASLAQIKKNLVGRWLNNACQFGEKI